MSYVIYNIESTYFMPGMKRGGYKSKGAATRSLNETAKRFSGRFEIAEAFNKLAYRSDDDVANGRFPATIGWRAAITQVAFDMNITANAVMDAINGKAYPFNKKDYAIADQVEFHAVIEKQVTKVNLMSNKKYQEPANTPISCSPASETYWSM